MYGQEIVWAATIACQEINENGGVLGRPLELFIEDDGSLPQSAVPAARKLIQEHNCSAIIGNLLSNARIDVAAKVADPLSIPYLNFSFYEGSISSRWFFHFAALPNQQIDRMIPFMAKRYGVKMFFAGNNYEWPRGSIDACKRALTSLNGEVVGEEYLPLGVRREEIDILLDRVVRSGADVFVPYFAGADQITLLTRFAEMGGKSKMAVVMGHFDEILAGFLTPEARTGLYSSNTYFMSVDTPQSRAYLARLKVMPEVTDLWPHGNGVLTNFGEGTYLCVKAFATAANKAGTLLPDDLAKALADVSVAGPQGEVRMNADSQHATVNTFLTRCQSDGSFEVIKTFGAITPSIPDRYKPPSRVLQDKRKSTVSNVQTISPVLKEAADIQGEIVKHIFEVANIAVLAMDGDGFIRVATRAASALFGYDPGEMVGLSIHLLVPPHLRSRHQEHLAKFIAGTETEQRMGQQGNIFGYRRDGTFFPLDATIAKFDLNGLQMLVATLYDLTDIKKIEEDLTRRATHDALTGLPNRALIYERIQKALNRSTTQSYNVGVLFIDLDGFKIINDEFGHAAGDYLLKEISQRLLRVALPGDTIGRLAGDEFVMLCEQVDTRSSLSNLADNILKATEKPVIYGSNKLYVTASIGISVGFGSTHSADDLIRAADAAMYSVKESGRAKWSFLSDALQTDVQYRQALSIGLRSAIERNEIYAVYQPIVDSLTSKIISAELLLRWRTNNEEITPALFIPVAELDGTIIPIGYWAFEHACRTECHWREQVGESAPSVSVNLSLRQMADPFLVEEFSRIINETKADPNRLVLEITETTFMVDPIANRKTIGLFSDLGLRIAMDDFGTGHSSLAQLLRLKVDILKIDKDFIQGIDTDPDTAVIVDTLCKMSKTFRMSIVAEGVETREQRDALLALGCDSLQGFYFHSPMSAEDILTAVGETDG